MIKDYTNTPQSNYSIHTDIESSVIDILKQVPYEQAIVHIKNIETELTRLNGLTIMQKVSKFAMEHPKIKEPSNSYKR